MPMDTPTTKGNLVAQFVESVHQMGIEVGAWRRFGEDVVAFLKARKLEDDFEEYRERLRKEADQRAAAVVNAKRRSRR